MLRRRRVSVALYTSPMPPEPSGATTRTDRDELPAPEALGSDRQYSQTASDENSRFTPRLEIRVIGVGCAAERPSRGAVKGGGLFYDERGLVEACRSRRAPNMAMLSQRMCRGSFYARVFSQSLISIGPSRLTGERVQTAE